MYKQEIEELKSKKIKEMEELIEIKTLKEKHTNELEQLQGQFLEEKAHLMSLKKQISIEKNKEHMYKSKMEKASKFEVQPQKVDAEGQYLYPTVSQYHTPMDGQYQKHVNGPFQEPKSKIASLPENYRDRRCSPN